MKSQPHLPLIAILEAAGTEEIATNHKSNQINSPQSEEIEIIKDMAKRMRIGEHKEDTIITTVEVQEEDITVDIKIEIVRDIEGTKEGGEDIEEDIKADAKANMSRIKDNQGNKILISKRETILTFLKLQMNQQSKQGQINKKTEQNEETEEIEVKLTLKAPTIIEVTITTDNITITEIIITIETTIITIIDRVTTIDNTNQKITTTTIIGTITTIIANRKILDLLKTTLIETRNLLMKLNRRSKILIQLVAFQKEGDVGHNQVFISSDVKWPLLIGLSATSTANYWLYPTPT